MNGTTVRRAAGIEFYKVGQDAIQLSLQSGQAVTVQGKGPLIQEVLNRLERPIAMGDLVQQGMEAGYDEKGVVACVNFLQKNGFATVVADAREVDPLVRLLESFQMGQAGEVSLRSVLGKLEAVVVGSGSVAACAQAALASLSCKVSALGDIGDVGVASERTVFVCCSDYDDFDLFHRVNSRALADGRQAYFARLSRGKLVMGPHLVPGHTACFACYSARLEANTSFILEFRGRTGGAANGGSDIAGFPPDSLLARGAEYHLALDFAWRLAGRPSKFREPEIRSVGLVTGDMSTAPLLRAPRCQACGVVKADDVKWAPRDLL